MDDDDAFLYGDDAPDIHPVDQKSSLPSQESVSQPGCLPSEPQHAKTLPLPLPSFVATLDQISKLPDALLTAPVPDHRPAPDLTQFLESKITSTQKLAIPDVHGQPSVQGGDANAEAEADEEEEEEEEDAQDGAADESDDDLDIILEGDTSQVTAPPPSRLSTQPARLDTPRDSAPLARPPEQTNLTTEYKPLERTDFKPLDPSLINALKPTTPSLNLLSSQHFAQLNTHNRLPTPDNFQAPSSPPPQPPPDTRPPDLAAENPVIHSSYEDKEGAALMDFDFDAIPEGEKGWKKPGAHVADWFNYGFDETTWKLYVMKQKRLRQEESWSANPFAAFATGNIQQAWDELPADLKEMMMQTIMGNASGPVNHSHGPQMAPSMPPMMVMNPMMQGMEMGGYGMQGMPNMMGGGNPPMNGAHSNPAMNSSHNEGPSRVIKQDTTGASDQGGETPAHYADEMDSREQQHHEQHRMQDQMRHMHHMQQHMGMGPGFMHGMDLAAIFGNQEPPMFMNGHQFNGMMEMPQMTHMQHMPPQMQQQMVGGPTMNLGIGQGMSSSVSSSGVNAGLVSQPARSASPSMGTPGAAPAAGSVNNHVATPGGSPRSMAVSSPAGGRGRGRGGRGRGNAQASAFLAAAAARGRGRVISAANSVMPTVPVNAIPLPSTSVETPPQAAPVPAPTSTSTSVASAPPVAEPSPERPTARPVSPLPSNVPTGPRRAIPALAGPPPRGPRVTPGGYFDKDAAGGRGDEGLDYGGGGAESPREDRKPVSRRHSHRSEREKLEEDPRTLERHEERSERSRSKSRDKEAEEKEGGHRSSKSRHRYRARSRSKEVEHRSGGREKEKEEGGHKSSKSANGSRRSRRSRRTGEVDEKEEEREAGGPGEDRERERDRERDRDRERERERDKERDKEREKDQDEEEHGEADYSAPTNGGSRKRKPKEERSSRSKRERAE